VNGPEPVFKPSPISLPFLNAADEAEAIGAKLIAWRMKIAYMNEGGRRVRLASLIDNGMKQRAILLRYANANTEG
jgi:hypothetical protein